MRQWVAGCSCGRWQLAVWLRRLLPAERQGCNACQLQHTQLVAKICRSLSTAILSHPPAGCLRTWTAC